MAVLFNLPSHSKITFLKILGCAVALVAGKPNAKFAKSLANLEDVCGASVTVGGGSEVKPNQVYIYR